MVSVDRTSRRQQHTTGTGRRLSCVLEKGCCHILLFCLCVYLPNGQPEWKPQAKQNVNVWQEKPTVPSSAFCVQLWSGHLDTVILMLSEVWCGNWRQHKWSVSNKMKSRLVHQGQQDRLMFSPKQRKDDTPASKCSVSGNNKKIKALLINHYPIDHDIERLKYATLLLSIETFPLLKCFGLYD